MSCPIRTVELIAWGLDDYGFRPRLIDHMGAAERLVAAREPYFTEDVVFAPETKYLHEELERQRLRPDLQEEMQGFEWELGVVDIASLLAFQRRLSFRPEQAIARVPAQMDWVGLMELSFPPQAPLICQMRHDPEGSAVTITSTNPNLHLRVMRDLARPIAVHGGSPFVEVAKFRGRVFLRDGYHRAAQLLQAGVSRVPAVLVRARTWAELGAVGPQFFGEAVLMGEHPPQIRDFLDPVLTVQYERPSTVTTLRLRMEEFITSDPVTGSGEQP